jgi:hypothetical protein
MSIIFAREKSFAAHGPSSGRLLAGSIPTIFAILCVMSVCNEGPKDNVTSSPAEAKMAVEI